MRPGSNKKEDSFLMNEYSIHRSEAMNEVLSRKPGLLSQWALVIFLIILSAIIGATWFIHYPDIIRTRAKLVATNAPKEIVTLQEGRLVRLFVKNNDSVSKGQILGYIESNARHEQVLLMNNLLDSMLLNLQKSNTQDIIKNFRKDSLNEIGELQQGYQQFIAAFQQFSDYLSDGFYLKKKKVLAEDLLYLQKDFAIVQQQKELLQKDLNLSEESYKANSTLLKEKVISKQDDRNEQSKLLSKQLNIPQINANILANEMHQREKQKEIIDLEHSISQQKIIFQQAIQTFQSQVNEWVRKFVLKAPVAGVTTFPSPLEENHFLTQGKTIMYINPENTSYYAEMNLPQYNFGKVEKSQIVQLRFDSYPYQEFGYVRGGLTYISDYASDSGFLAHIQLPDGLITNQHKKLHYRDGLTAEAQIITKDMRLMERFYYNIVSNIKR